MNVDTMSTIMVCLIILHNMWIEESLELDVREKKEEIYADDIIFGAGITSMWAGLERVSGREFISASAGSIYRGLRGAELHEGRGTARNDKASAHQAHM